ncbi:MAG: hypothetical protein ABFS21_07710 [Actinomycetota bacterium]
MSTNPTATVTARPDRFVRRSRSIGPEQGDGGWGEVGNQQRSTAMKRHLTITILVVVAVFGAALSASAEPIEGSGIVVGESPSISYLEEAKHLAMTGEDLNLQPVEVLPNRAVRPQSLKEVQMTGRYWNGPYLYEAFSYQANSPGDHSDQLIEGVDEAPAPAGTASQPIERPNRKELALQSFD